MTRDPHAVLGLAPGAGPEEAAAAYRALAKRWHPDRARGADAARRMAEINAAYDLLRAERWLTEHRGMPAAPPREREEDAFAARAARRAQAGAWLPEALRRALGRELLAALERDEDVRMVTPAATWASPQALLALTDRRLLWLLDDAPTHRVRSLRFRDIDCAAHRLRRPLRRSAVLRVRTTAGRRISFSELRPATAAALSRALSRQAGLETSSTRSATESRIREAR
ncbi:MAG: DnaJ domain-containing protein [Solirubrobacteraceae bacterium]